MTDRNTPSHFHGSDGVGDWRVLDEGAFAFFRTGSFAAGARLVAWIGELAGIDDHHEAMEGSPCRALIQPHRTTSTSRAKGDPEAPDSR